MTPKGPQPFARALLVMMVAGAFCLCLSGCATNGYVGVSTFPNYSPYYRYYGYSGVPYYGYRGIYTRNIIVRGRRHSLSYGRHHLWRDRRRPVRNRVPARLRPRPKPPYRR